MTTLRFPGCSNEYANGYGCKYTDMIRFKGRNPNDREYNVVYGVVDRQKIKQDNFGRAYVSIGVFLGADNNGIPQSAVIHIKNRALMALCGTLKPKECGEKRWLRFDVGKSVSRQAKREKIIMFI